MQFLKQILLPTAVLAMGITGSAHAQHQRGYNPIALTGQIGYAFGGEDLIEVSGESDFQAGDGVEASLGVLVDLAPQTSLELSAGVKVNDEDYDNGDGNFTRFPLTATLFIEPVPELRLGAGLTYHVNPEFDGRVGFSTVNTEFDDAAGFVLQADWQFSPQVYAGLRYTGIEYEGDSVNGEIDGSALGFHVGFNFR